MKGKLFLFIAVVACLALPLGHLAAQDDTLAAAGAPWRLLYNGLHDGAVYFDYTAQEIFTVNADGTGQTRLTFNDIYDGEAAWSPDGTRIAFVQDTPGYSERPLYVMNADGSNLIHLADLPTTPGRPTWSPDGAKLAFRVNLTYQLYIVNSDGSGLVAVEGVSGDDPSWSPDGQLIAFAGNGVNSRTDIFVVKPDGTGLTNLTMTPSAEGTPDWSPDGSRIVFSRFFSGGNIELYTMNQSGGDHVRLTNTADKELWPSWAPDGQQIAYVSWRWNDDNELIAHIFTMNADGSNPQQITNGLGEYYPDWQSRDGGPATTFLPTNDAHVMSNKKAAVFNKPKLQVRDAAADTNSYVKFNLTGLEGSVQSATLRLWVVDGGPDGGRVFATSPYYRNTTTQWLETGLKWNNAPLIEGAALGNLGPVSPGGWVEMDVTVAVTGNGRVSFALTNDSANLIAYSSGEGAHPPELIVITSD